MRFHENGPRYSSEFRHGHGLINADSLIRPGGKAMGRVLYLFAVDLFLCTLSWSACPGGSSLPFKSYPKAGDAGFSSPGVDGFPTYTPPDLGAAMSKEAGVIDPNCDDGNPCTVDINQSGTCVHKKRGTVYWRWACGCESGQINGYDPKGCPCGTHAWTVDNYDMSQWGFTKSAAAFGVADQSWGVGAALLYEHQNGKDYLLSMNSVEAGYPTQYTTPLGYCFTAQLTGTVPLYRLLYPSIPRHFSTISSDEKNMVIQQYNYKDDGITCYICPPS
jgi:hypothetical protein